jgi:hypothetical protein
MGNGVLLNLICCNSKKAPESEDIDINKNKKENNIINSRDNNIDDKNISNNEINKINMKNKYKKIKTQYNQSSDKKKMNKNNDALSNKDPNISLYNNTFQILNNTQQFISISNKINLFKNNLVNNNNNNQAYKYKSYFNSIIDLKNSSIIKLSRVPSSIEEIFQLNIKTRLILSGELFLNDIIEIDKFGIKNGLRKKHDGVAIFGIKNNKVKSKSCIYDYLIDFRNEDNPKKAPDGKVFEIFLDKKEKVYILSFSHNSLLLYYKINNSFFFDIDKKYYLILGDIFLTIGVKKSSTSNERMINIQVETEDEKPKKYSFERKDLPIKIGRINSNINIPNPSISKTHGIIDISNNMFYYNDMKSTNGSTLLLKEDDVLKIQGEMNFKLDDFSFKIKEIENEDEDEGK